MLILHFDYPSAASAVAVLRLQALADDGATVAFRGFDVLGLDRSIPATLDQLEELERERDRAAALGLPLRRPTRRPPTLAAHVIGEVADQHGLGASWRWCCLRGYWGDDADLGDDDVLLGLAGDAGLDGDEVARLLADRQARTDARWRMLEARSRGIGGVPVLEVDGTFLSVVDVPDDDLRALAAL